MRGFFLLILFFIPVVSLYSQSISGNVQDNYFNQPVANVYVTLKDYQSGNLLGKDSTDTQGNYNITFVINAIGSSTQIPSTFELSNPYPQPFNPSTRFDFSNPTGERFTARIYNIIGQLVYSKSFDAAAGNHSLVVSGLGSAGVYIFNLTGNHFSATKKLMLLDGGSGNVNVQLVGGSPRNFNKVTAGNLLLEFTRAGYYTRDSVVTLYSAEAEWGLQPPDTRFPGICVSR